MPKTAKPNMQALLKFDLGKLAGWQFWSAEIKAETRVGGPLVTGTGTTSSRVICRFFAPTGRRRIPPWFQPRD